MGWNDNVIDSELSELPEYAHDNKFDIYGPFEPNNSWLKEASDEHQVIAMKEWFTARFCDPVEDTPYVY